jgi:DNA repair protein RecO (recombination protein O)
VAELLDELLPDREANDAIFRLTVAVLQQLQVGAIWMPLTYFELWLARLVGFLPELGECAMCGAMLNGSRAFYHPLVDGLMCADDKRMASREIAPESRAIASQMFRTSVESLATGAWPKQRAADLRRLVTQILERHLEKKLVTATMLDKVE